jgi:hypothetical protein
MAVPKKSKIKLPYGRRGIKENDGGVNSAMIYCKTFVNVKYNPSTITTTNF